MTDEELMVAVCEGDRSAYRTIVNQHLGSISHYAFRILGNSKDTEDISQEVFLRLWTNAHKWQGEKAKLSTWLHRIAHNLCIDHIRKHGRVDTKSSFDEDHFENNGTGSDIEGGVEGGFESKSEENEKFHLLKQAMDQLPESQRSALALCHYQGFSNKGAAAIMNISVSAVESALARAKRSLKERLLTAAPENSDRQD
jgi:RNA polymerase sigma-70 factor, ECF subfamily